MRRHRSLTIEQENRWQRVCELCTAACSLDTQADSDPASVLCLQRLLAASCVLAPFDVRARSAPD